MIDRVRAGLMALGLLCFGGGSLGAQGLSVMDKVALGLDQGRIEGEEGNWIRLWALVDPDRVPKEYRSDPGVPWECGTLAARDLIRRRLELSDALRGAVERGLMAPRDQKATTCIESTLYPVTVCYGMASHANMAHEILGWAEEAWRLEVDQAGFLPPQMEEGGRIVPGQVLTIGRTDPGVGGYTAPVPGNPDTAWLDCYSSIVISDRSSGLIPTVVPHEFCHACQVAMDCIETTSAMESTADWASYFVAPESLGLLIDHTRSFQRTPHYPIDYDNYFAGSTFEYGAWIWVAFLDHVYGNQDGTFVAELWNGTIQSSYINEPDMLDSIDSLLWENGEYGLPGAWDNFGRWRYHMGRNDDGAHLPFAGDMTGCEVHIENTHDLEDLPVEAVRPYNPPAEFGANYILLRTAGAEVGDEVVLQFSGEAGWDWSVMALLRPESGEDREMVMAVNQAMGEMTIPVGGTREVIIIVANLSDGDHDPDNQDWDDVPYTYSLLPLREPSLLSMEPSFIVQGSVQEVLLSGGGYQRGAQVLISGEGVAVEEVLFESAQLLRVRVSALADAPTGARNVTITNPFGGQCLVIGALSVRLAPAPVVTGAEPSRLEPGEGAYVMVSGQGFFEGASVAVRPEGVEVGQVDFVDGGRLLVRMVVEEGAWGGLRDVVVTNPNGAAGVGEGIVYIDGILPDVGVQDVGEPDLVPMREDLAQADLTAPEDLPTDLAPEILPHDDIPSPDVGEADWNQDALWAEDLAAQDDQGGWDIAVPPHGEDGPAPQDDLADESSKPTEPDEGPGCGC